MIGDFHFVRPLWLLALLPCAALTWALLRRDDPARARRKVIAPHLLPYLLIRPKQSKRLSPLALMAAAWTIAIVAIAGPTWRREPAPFADDTAALAIVIKVSPSMLTEDVQPSRLTRSTQKIHDLLTLRRGAKTALIAYAGTAHRVMPVTTDGGIIDTFAQALDPKIMPIDGDAAADALHLAEVTLAGGGSILWITDSIAAEQSSAVAAWRNRSRMTIRLLAPLLPGEELEALHRAAEPARPNIVSLSADASDVAALARAAKFSAVATSDPSGRWQESGYWLTPLLAALLLPFFRQGWMATPSARG